MITGTGWMTRVTGTLAATVGVIVILVHYNRPAYENGYFIGALLVVGGLLLRIEGAIWAVFDRTAARPTPDDQGGRDSSPTRS